jgi:hypothetical protein
MLSTGAAVAGGLVLIAFATGAGQPQHNPDYGFILTNMGMTFYRGDEKIDCPEGRSHSLREAYLATQTPAEQARLLKPENSVELEHKYKEDYVFGPGGRDICTSAAFFDTPDREVQKMTRSKIGTGLDLDGAAAGATAPGTCAHEKFTSPAGEKGIDNQFYRAIGCTTAWRGALAGGKGDFSGDLRWNENPAVVIVRGVQSWENDPDVEVIVGSTPDKPTLDATGQIVTGGSLAITDNPRYRLVLKGRIENGVLTTEPGNLVLPHNWVGASGGEILINHFRIRARMTPSGELVGEAGGYRPLDNAIATLEVGGPGVANTAGVECASVRKTMRILADGDPDPKTGACTSISEGLDFGAKPAFVFDKGVLIGAPGGGGALRQAQR